MRALVAYFFLIIFSLQVLPVKEIGKLLCKSQITEEDVSDFGEADDDMPDTKLKKEIDPLHYSHRLEVARVLHFALEVRAVLYHHSVCLPAFHVPDIFTPPPNCA